MALLATIPSNLHQDLTSKLEETGVWASESHVKYWLKQLQTDYSNCGASNASSSAKSQESDPFLSLPEENDDMVLGAEAKHFSNFANILSPNLSPMIYTEEKESNNEIICTKTDDTKINDKNTENAQKSLETLNSLVSPTDLQSTEKVHAAASFLRRTNKCLESGKFESFVDETGSSVDTSILLASALVEDPEILLFNLGFGSSLSTPTIPARFFQQPSSALGINVDDIQRSMFASYEDTFFPSFDESPSNPISHPRFSESSVDITSTSSDLLPAHIRRVLFNSNNENVPSIHILQDGSVTPSSESSSWKKLTTLQEVPEPRSNSTSFDMDKQKVNFDNLTCDNIVYENANIAPLGSLMLPRSERISVSDRSTCSLMTVVNSNNENSLNSSFNFKPIQIDDEFVKERSSTLCNNEKSLSEESAILPLILTQENLIPTSNSLDVKTESILTKTDSLNDVTSKRIKFARCQSPSVDDQKSNLNDNSIKDSFINPHDFSTSTNLTATSSPQHSSNIRRFFRNLKSDGKEDPVNTNSKATYTPPSNNQAPLIPPNNNKSPLTPPSNKKTPLTPTGNKNTPLTPTDEELKAEILVTTVNETKETPKNGEIQGRSYISSALHSLSKILSPTHSSKLQNHASYDYSSNRKVPLNKYVDSSTSLCFDAIVNTSDSTINSNKWNSYKDLSTSEMRQTSQCQEKCSFFLENGSCDHIQTSYQGSGFLEIPNNMLLKNNDFCSLSDDSSSRCQSKTENPKIKERSLESSGFEEDHSEVKCPFGKNCSINHGQRNSHDRYKKCNLCEVCEKKKSLSSVDFNMTLSHDHFNYLVQQISRLRADILEQNRLQVLRENQMKEHFSDLIFDIKLKTEGIYFDNLSKEISLLRKSLQEKDFEISQLKNAQMINQSSR